MIWETITNTFDVSQLTTMKEGKYKLDNGIWVDIASYQTKKYDEKKYEVHKKYIDVQYMIEGEEIVYVACEKNIKKSRNYDVQNDIEYYDEEYSANTCILKPGQHVVIMPEIAHKPCVCMEKGPEIVKKAVFKLPISLIKHIKCVVMDVDGTLTDGMIYMGNNGECFKQFNIKDGYGIANILPSNGIIPIIITGRCSEIVANRCKELHIKEFHQGCNDKMTMLLDILEKNNFELNNVVYIGDDINDIQCMQAVRDGEGIVACPGDAVQEVKNIANYISIMKGGHGAVRDIIDWICV